jgi:methylenetetrahydrofolate reductase (NADPH)
MAEHRADPGAPDPVAGAFRSLERVRLEILPLKGVEEQIAHLPAGATVTVRSSPTWGGEATFALCEQLLAAGDWRVVPHLAARLVRDRAHVEALLARIADLGIREVFVIAGDAPEPAGPYAGAVDLLRAMADVGHALEEVGITGYPESHAFIPDGVTIRAMAEKVPYATYIVSQICYEPATIVRWVETVRARGIHLPIYLGIPGVVDRSRLLRISLKVGLGDSVRYLRKQHGVLGRLVSGYTPDELVAGLAPVMTDPAAGVRGWHLFTFNEVEKTEAWRRELLARAGRSQA